MEYLGDKLSVAHSQVSGWVGNVRRSLHGALNFLSSSVERGGRGEDGTGNFKRTNSLRSLASRSRESIRRFSLRSQQRLSLRRRTAPNTPTAVRQHTFKQKPSVSGEDEGKDSETPVHETDSQYGTWETGLRTDDRYMRCTVRFLCLDVQAPTTLLDTSALRSRAQLGKKRAPRTRPTRAARQNAAQAALADREEESAEDWLYRDSTEEKAESKNDDSGSADQAKGADASPAVASQPQRVALFPGMDPSALKAQLKKRSDSDNQTDAPAPSPSQISRSPKSPFLPRAARVLPPPGGKENGEEDSPQWLKELKSKKRLSQYENES
uniref:Si:ch73-138n13.1 n=1 Tax=Sphaeramia orbicularis TaxID=375764 RepID=A0A673CJF7_9TELE